MWQCKLHCRVRTLHRRSTEDVRQVHRCEAIQGFTLGGGHARVAVQATRRLWPRRDVRY